LIADVFKYTLEKELQKYVKYAWIMKAYEAKSKQDLLIPDGYPEIIFVKKGAYHKEYLDQNSTSITINNSCIIGIQTQSVLASRRNNCHLVGLKLQPVGAYTLFGENLKNISPINKPLNEFGVEWLGHLDEKIQNCEGDESIIKLLAETLLHQIDKLENDQLNELAASFLATILNIKGQISVQELAKQHCLSIRHFQRKFKGFFGISPKKFLNIIRFKHLYKSSTLQQKLPANFLEYGYYDQMHFIKDFQKKLGVNPSKSVEKAFLQMNKMAQINS